MTNSFVTCLRNLSRAAVPDPGEEYTPADFRPAELPDDLAAAREALFGHGADRAGTALTASRITAYLATSKFAASVTRDDPRLTYDPLSPAALWDSVGTSVVTSSGGPPVAWSGSASFRRPGRAYGVWAVEADGAGNYVVTPRGSAAASGPVTEADLGDVIPLPGSHLSVIVPAGDPGRWAVTLLTPPSHPWASAADHPAEGVFDPSAGGDETEWYAAWSDPYAPAPLRASALALAVSARVLELVTGSGGRS